MGDSTPNTSTTAPRAPAEPETANIWAYYVLASARMELPAEAKLDHILEVGKLSVNTVLKQQGLAPRDLRAFVAGPRSLLMHNRNAAAFQQFDAAILLEDYDKISGVKGQISAWKKGCEINLLKNKPYRTRVAELQDRLEAAQQARSNALPEQMLQAQLDELKAENELAQAKITALSDELSQATLEKRLLERRQFAKQVLHNLLDALSVSPFKEDKSAKPLSDIIDELCTKCEGSALDEDDIRLLGQWLLVSRHIARPVVTAESLDAIEAVSVGLGESHASVARIVSYSKSSLPKGPQPIDSTPALGE